MPTSFSSLSIASLIRRTFQWKRVVVRASESESASSSWDFTLPPTEGSAGQVLQNTGAGVSRWAWADQGNVLAVSNANYTITDADGYGMVLVTTGASGRTITLPTLADNFGRIVTVKKVDSGAGAVTVDGEGSETLDGAGSMALTSQYDAVTLRGTTAEWAVVSKNP